MIKKFNVTGDRRKELVKALSEILETKSQYCGMPSCAYQVGDVIIDKDGTVTGNLSEETLRLLSERGFTAETQEEEISAPLTFDSDAKEIQHRARQILSDGKIYTAKELKARVAQAAGRQFSLGAYAGAFRELIESDCRYCTEERGNYRYVAFDGDADLLPFVSAIVSLKGKLTRLREKSNFSNQATADNVSTIFQTVDALIAELWKSE